MASPFAIINNQTRNQLPTPVNKTAVIDTSPAVWYVKAKNNGDYFEKSYKDNTDIEQYKKVNQNLFIKMPVVYDTSSLKEEIAVSVVKDNKLVNVKNIILEFLQKTENRYQNQGYANITAIEQSDYDRFINALKGWYNKFKENNSFNFSEFDNIDSLLNDIGTNKKTKTGGKKSKRRLNKKRRRTNKK
jgi:hypothetical protein